DETDRIAGKLVRWADSGEVDVILTTGGTGLTARDVTAEATEAVVDRLAPGLGEALRGVAAPKFPRAWLPRGLAGPPGKPLCRHPPPDCVVVTGGLHESGAAQLLTLARDRSVSTLGLVEETEPDAKGLARRLGLTGYLEKPADPAEVAATVRRLIERRKLQQR